MIYTIGSSKSYDEALAKGPVKKQGKTDQYEGGCCWRTAIEAFKWLDANQNQFSKYSVYSVDADFDKNTYYIAGSEWNSLLIDSPIIGKVDRIVW